MRKIPLVLSMLVSILVIFIACSKDKKDEPSVCDGVYNKSFVTDVNPLIQTYCNQAACHEPGSINGPGSLTNYSQIFNARVKIREQVSAGLMPQNTTLTTAQKNSIICWIDSGAPNN